MSVLVKQQVALKKRKLSSRQWQQHNTVLGQLGENQAVHFLSLKNHLIKAQNIVTRSGEIDIIAIDVAHQELVFCEVKTRTHTHFGHPSSAWNWKKARNLLSAASDYLVQHPSKLDIRFDLIVVSPSGVTHYTNITT